MFHERTLNKRNLKRGFDFGPLGESGQGSERQVKGFAGHDQTQPLVLCFLAAPFISLFNFLFVYLFVCLVVCLVVGWLVGLFAS